MAADWPSIADIAEFEQIDALRQAKARMKAEQKAAKGRR